MRADQRRAMYAKQNCHSKKLSGSEKSKIKDTVERIEVREGATPKQAERIAKEVTYRADEKTKQL